MTLKWVLYHPTAQVADSVHPFQRTHTPLTFQSSCLCCHFISLFIFSPDFRSFYSAGHWQHVNHTGLGSEKIIVQAWPRALRGQSASVNHLMLSLHPPGGTHRPACTVSTDIRNRSDFRFHLVQLSSGETETWRDEGSSPRACIEVLELGLKLCILNFWSNGLSHMLGSNAQYKSISS